MSPSISYTNEPFRATPNGAGGPEDCGPWDGGGDGVGEGALAGVGVGADGVAEAVGVATPMAGDAVATRPPQLASNAAVAVNDATRWMADGFDRMCPLTVDRAQRSQWRC